MVVIKVGDFHIGGYYSTRYGVVRVNHIDNIGKRVWWTKIRKTKGIRYKYEHGADLIEHTKDWVLLDITDFPESPDKQLPYVFDLLFDIKTMSQLRRELKNEHKQELLELMKDYGIRFEKKK